MTASKATRILIVDDEASVGQMLARGLWEAGYPCVTATNGQDALVRLRQGGFDLMLSDIRMPGMDGLDLLRFALQLDPDLVVVMVTAMAGLETAMKAIHAGAYDYVTKPFHLDEVRMAVERGLELRRLKTENRRHTRHLEDLVEERTTQIRRIAVEVVTTLGLALEAKDEWTHDHSRRVAEVAAGIGTQLGQDELQCGDLRLAGMLHDIGKIGVREAVLHKPDNLTAEEFRHIMLHPDLGARILSPIHDLHHILPFIRHHHERWDGSGYPDHLAGESIPFGARIIGVADAYVAMRERRPYRAGMRKDRALEELRLGAQRQFDLHIVGALLDLDRTGTLEQLDQEFPQDVPEMSRA